MIFFAGRLAIEFSEIRIAFAKRAAIEPAAVTDELVQVRVGPTHRDLDDVVQPVEGQVRGHDHAPPDGGSRPFQRDLELVERRGGGLARPDVRNKIRNRFDCVKGSITLPAHA